MVRAGRVGDAKTLDAIAALSPQAPQWSAREFAAMLADAGSAALRRVVLVAEREGAVAGFAVYTLITTVFPPGAELESLAVSPEHRRQGVATELLRVVCGAVAEAGGDGLLLEVRAGNAGAIALYEGTGFVRCGLRRAYYLAPVEDAVVMRRSL